MTVKKKQASKVKQTAAPSTIATKAPEAKATATPGVNTTPSPVATTKPVQTNTPEQTAAPVVSPQVTPESSATPVPTPLETPFVTLPEYETGTPEMPQFSTDTGVYNEAFYLQMASQPGTQIYYTTDGSIPTASSLKYANGFDVVCRNGMPNVLSCAENIKKMYISNSGYDYTPKDNEVDKCTIIRAVAIAPDGTMSNVVTKSYFVGNDVKTKYAGANVVSLVIDPDSLLNYETGIHVLGKLYDDWKATAEGKSIINSRAYWNYVGNYTQSGKDWERVANMDYINSSTEKLEFSAPIGVRGHGGASRMYGQKSFNLYMREEYGMKNLKYPLLPGDVNAEGKQIKKYKSFMFRNGGNDTEYTKLRDVFTQDQLTDRAYGTQASTPCVVFLNGEYWGLYNMTEKYSDASIEENYGVSKDNVVVVKEGELDEGEDEDMALYDELQSYSEKDLTDASVYADFCNIMDIDSFADYYATEIYIANHDWNPEKNIELWRSRTADAENSYADCKWRYLLYDTEYAMGLYGSSDAKTKSFTSAMQNDPLFASVMRNTEFRAKFLTAIKEIGSVNFKYETVSAKLDEMAATYKPLMQTFFDRFYGAGSGWPRSGFDSNINTMKDFLKDRYSNIISDVENYKY